MRKRHPFLEASLILLTACSTSPPRTTDNICTIFRQKDGWYQDAKQAELRWGTPIALQMAFMKQESSFVADAKPARPLILGFIPWFRASSAYGYPQAKDETWDDYQKNADQWLVSRDDFGDSCDFIAWYCATTRQKLGIPYNNIKHHYLAYHEGRGGFQRRTYTSKAWLLETAQKVEQQAQRYNAQLAGCKPQLEAEN